MPGFTEISPTQLMRLLGGPDAPALVDVCIDEDFDTDPHLIPGARRVPFDRIETVMGRAMRYVVICQRGRKLSHGAAAMLRAQGAEAQVLEGGNQGWRDAGLPRVRVAALPQVAEGVTRWVTRHRPKIDRIACPWLIRRFVDPDAQFLFVPPADVAMVAEKFDAQPFDMPGDPRWGHRADGCSFDTLVAEFGLAHAALDRLADVVRAADLDDLARVPQAAGLLAMSVGLSRLYRDDTRQLEAGLTLYDALYRWARDGFDEAHTGEAAT